MVIETDNLFLFGDSKTLRCSAFCGGVRIKEMKKDDQVVAK